MNLSDKSKSLTFTAVLALLIKGLGAVCTYGMFVAMAHLLSPEQYGRFAYGINAAIVFSSLTSFGFPVGILRYVPQYLIAGNSLAVKGVASAGFRFVFLGSLIFGLLAFATAQFQNFETTTFVLFCLLLSIAAAISDYASNLLRALGSTIVSMVPRDIIWRILTPISVLALLWSGFMVDANSALLTSAIVLIALNIWQARTAWTMLPKTKGQFQIKTIQASLVPLWAASLLYALIQQFDVVIVGSLLQKSDAGSYFAAQKTAQLLSLVLLAGGLATVPKMTALFHSNQLQDLQKLCNKLAIAIASVTLLGFLFVLIFGKMLLSIFDPSFVSVYPVLIVLAAGAVIDAIAGPTAFLMQMTKLERTYVWIMASCYLLVIMGQIILIPHYGMVGAALASASGTIIWNLVSIYWLRKKVNLDPSLLSLFFPPVIDSQHGKPQS